jgi:hypothetical protein
LNLANLRRLTQSCHTRLPAVPNTPVDIREHPRPLTHRLQLLFLLFVLVVGSWFLSRQMDIDGCARRGVDLPGLKKELKKSKPDLLVVGDSMASTRLDQDLLTEISGKTSVVFSPGGSGSGSWYLYLKNVLAESEHRPKTVVLMFRDNQLTWPHLRATGAYAAQIRRLREKHELIYDAILRRQQESEDNSHPIGLAKPVWGALVTSGASELYRQEVRDLAMDLSNLGEGKTERLQFQAEYFGLDRLRHDLATNATSNTDPTTDNLWDDYTPIPRVFDANPKESFLPAMIKLASDLNVELILYRAQRRRDAYGLPLETWLETYNKDLENWLRSQGIRFVDERPVNGLKSEYYSDTDHISEEYRPLATDLFYSLIKEPQP